VVIGPYRRRRRLGRESWINEAPSVSRVECDQSGRPTLASRRIQ
jgi:hypothetical protein